MSGNNVLVLKNFDVPKTPGAHYRLICMNGDRKGEVYYLKGNRIVMGRADTCDIKIFDSKSSREHAEIVKVGSGFVITDLKSQNGVTVNNNRIKQAQLKDGDVVIVGRTVFKFGRVKVKDNNPDIEQANDKKDSRIGIPEEEKVGKRKLFIVAIALAVMWWFLSEEESQKNQRRKQYIGRTKRSDITEEFIREQKKKDRKANKEIERVIKTMVHEGLRELREENYYRALEKFRDVLELDKNNSRAKRYEKITLNFLENKIESMFLKARRDVDALRHKSAATTYCDIMRILQMDPDDQRFKDAKENVRLMEEKMGLEKDAIECL